MGHPFVHTVHFVTGPDMRTKETRLARGTKVTVQSATSALVQANADFKAAGADVVTVTIDLKQLVDDYNKYHGLFKAARDALGVGIVRWDTKYRVYTTVASKYVLTAEDASAAGLDMRTPVNHLLAMPDQVEVAYRPKKDDLRIHVHRAKGMKTCSVQISNNPSDPTSWKELDGDGAVRLVPHPAPGTWWVRAASKVARATSDWTTPVSAIVK
jgi:hypothetical protein